MGNESHAAGSTYYADQLDHMERLIEEYSRSKVSTPGPSQPPRRRGPVTSSILLTGSTGNLGSDVLALLLRDPSVTKIYALNRRSSRGPASERVRAQFSAKGLDVAALESEKLVYLEGDATQDDLGLGGSVYTEFNLGISDMARDLPPKRLSWTQRWDVD
ncbi:hypothetical protein DXG03_007941 [Asterophora parasitica]|uniref:Thioester reductase (TE) domain-containing protein n=1 Tax=Asterophora parasitica TaxID=117018 RepID=A0A9P7G628_9AGAR|nr:hypothetical protein DXG03_007941 [Asterophora parasitica]